MVSVMVIIFWSGYGLITLSLLAWLAKHPLMIGAVVLLSYMFGSVIVMMSLSFIVGIFLFLAGVSGMMVAFLYVVALCPNPVFKEMDEEQAYLRWVMGWVFILFVNPMFIMFMGEGFSFSVEVSSMGEEMQWLREPCMYSGLADLMPFLGVLLFLCMVSVVSLCGQQKQCLGGHGGLESGSNVVNVKRFYA